MSCSLNLSQFIVLGSAPVWILVRFEGFLVGFESFFVDVGEMLFFLEADFRLRNGGFLLARILKIAFEFFVFLELFSEIFQ